MPDTKVVALFGIKIAFIFALNVANKEFDNTNSQPSPAFPPIRTVVDDS